MFFTFCPISSCRFCSIAIFSCTCSSCMICMTCRAIRSFFRSESFGCGCPKEGLISCTISLILAWKQVLIGSCFLAKQATQSVQQQSREEAELTSLRSLYCCSTCSIWEKKSGEKENSLSSSNDEVEEFDIDTEIIIPVYPSFPWAAQPLPPSFEEAAATFEEHFPNSPFILSMIKGTDQSESSDNEGQAIPAIDKSLVANPTISLEHLICSICHYIVWDPVACGSPSGCHNAYCASCITLWLENSNKQCPTCKRPFVKSVVPPILKALLQNLVIRCPQGENGCTEVISYNDMPLHLKECLFKVQKCPGCKKKVILKHYSSHLAECEYLVVECARCKDCMPKSEFKSHSRCDCFKKEIESCGERVESISHSIDQIGSSLSKLENLTRCFLSGEPLQLNIELYTTFNQHFVFPHPTLIKPSFNQIKEKFDFLHFYVVNPIYSSSIVSIKWAIKINKMIGNILIGFCSSMTVNSLDFVINKYGDLKRKAPHENKYKLVRKSPGFLLSCGDTIRFRYSSMPKCIRIENESRRVEMRLEAEQLEQLGDKIYTFYSMDTLNDSISFVS